MLEIQQILKIHKCGLGAGGYFEKICDQHREFRVEEYLMTRNIGNRGICGLKSGGGGHTAVQAIAHPEMSPVLLQRRSLLTFFHQFGSLGRGEGGAWGGVGSMGEGNVGDGQEAWQSYTDGPIGLRTYFIFSKYLSLLKS